MEPLPAEEQPILRSIHHDKSSFVQFVNRTNRDVTIYWVDYQGRAINYGLLAPGNYVDINTFVTHPWIFVDKETGDRYTIEQKDVFFPRETLTPDGRPYRHRAFITLPLYSLRELALRVVRNHLQYDSQALVLDLPYNLEAELVRMLPSPPEEVQQRNNRAEGGDID